MQTVLDGVAMEINDSVFPLVHSVVATTNLAIAFKDIDAAFLVGAMPRRQGMERKDLLAANVKVFFIVKISLNFINSFFYLDLDFCSARSSIGFLFQTKCQSSGCRKSGQYKCNDLC